MEKTKIIYADSLGQYHLYRKPIKSSGTIYHLAHGQNFAGYGSKITTDIMLQFDGKNRGYRVYTTCFSNCASHWIVKKGVKLHLHDYEEIEK